MTDSTPTAIDLVGRAYLYYYPLVENLAQVERYVTTGVGSNPAAPFNSFSHARKLADETDTFVTINNDTVYSMGSLDLSVGPLRLEVPPTGDRYHVLQFVDAWTNNFAYIGTRATGNDGGTYLITPPGWTGDVPEGQTQIAAPTTIVSIVGRFACDGPDDIGGVAALQDQLVLTPVAADAVAPTGIPTPAPGVDPAIAFLEQARVLSQAFRATPGDLAYAAQFAPLGVDEAASPYVDADPTLVADLAAGLDAGKAQMEQTSHHGHAPVVNGWTVGLHMFDYNLEVLGLGTIDEPAWKMAYPDDTRYVLRAVADRLGLWGNHGYEAVYCQAFTDIDGEPLVGASSYTIDFDQDPPVGAFWSITMYDIPDYYLVANPIRRFSIGDRTAGIQRDGQGTLTLTITHDEPTDPTARANWLPAPGGSFRLVFRLYIPGPPILDGSYDFPPIRRSR
ncbi:DUF1254 domain-containing protein [Aquihabitans sp. McL0605]|uniref:DUF1254 domain-containing protein n=1 Tax=Aquihabitans sp. McL0605 TaxID=3415671 RepID=UPI003CEF89C7